MKTNQITRAEVLATSTVILLPALVLLGGPWSWAWISLGISFATTVLSPVIMARLHPDMLEEQYRILPGMW